MWKSGCGYFFAHNSLKEGTDRARKGSKVPWGPKIVFSSIFFCFPFVFQTWAFPWLFVEKRRNPSEVTWTCFPTFAGTWSPATWKQTTSVMASFQLTRICSRSWRTTYRWMSLDLATCWSTFVRQCWRHLATSSTWLSAVVRRTFFTWPSCACCCSRPRLPSCQSATLRGLRAKGSRLTWLNYGWRWPLTTST